MLLPNSSLRSSVYTLISCVPLNQWDLAVCLARWKEGTKLLEDRVSVVHNHSHAITNYHPKLYKRPDWLLIMWRKQEAMSLHSGKSQLLLFSLNFFYFLSQITSHASDLLPPVTPAPQNAKCFKIILWISVRAAYLNLIFTSVHLFFPNLSSRLKRNNEFHWGRLWEEQRFVLQILQPIIQWGGGQGVCLLVSLR